ncbi:mitochondrial assembly of ribosomal large subunit protein 1 isoform X2 [Tiliqua scincoides]|uniref:mitochondrial assembly of ribosomal large subunit protein 1 isoform X2 n=1 Tax=Tiliqua scincoides TaxID=71010 RepID=UPI003461F20A
MWRRGARCLWPLLVPSRGAAVAGSGGGARRLREPGSRAFPSPSPSWGARVGLRGASGAARSRVWGAEEEVAAGAGQQHEEAGGQEPLGEPSDPPSSVFSIDYMVSLLRQENAKDICVIQLPPEMKYTDYFIIVSGSSTRHLHAMAHYLIKMYKHLKADCDPHVVIEGKDCDDWLCLDLGNIVIHLMLPETREIYELEKLWTLRSYDDQLAQIAPESLPDDFIFGLTSEQP